MSETARWIFAIAVLLSVAIAWWRGRLSAGLQILFLIRWQAFLTISPILIALLSIKVPEMFGNLVILDPSHPCRESFYVAFVGFASAWMSLALVTIVLDRAQERFRVELEVPHWFWLCAGLLFTAPPLVLMWRVHRASANFRWLGFGGGFVAALLIVLVVDTIFHLLDPPPALTGRPVRRFAFAGSLYPFLVTNANPMGRVSKLIFRPLHLFDPGYLWPDQGPGAPADPGLVGLPYPEQSCPCRARAATTPSRSSRPRKARQ
ncbi:MAG TPA: hypothetical protein VIX59_06125 [Candidatus Binataceae bacterium]